MLKRCRRLTVVQQQAGAIVGALVANPLADWIGRKKSILFISVFAFIGGLLQALSYGSLVCFYIGRCVAEQVPSSDPVS